MAKVRHFINWRNGKTPANYLQLSTAYKVQYLYPAECKI